MCVLGGGQLSNFYHRKAPEKLAPKGKGPLWELGIKEEKERKRPEEDAEYLVVLVATTSSRRGMDRERALKRKI